MLRLMVIVTVIVVALLRGGSLRNFAGLRLRWLPLVLGGLALQLLIFTPWSATPLIARATPQLYLLSMTLLAAWVALNWRVQGMALMAAGLLLNFVALGANGGYMPVSPASAQLAGNLGYYSDTGLPVAYNSIATDSDVRLWLLTDIIPLPQPIPFANVFSIGDILLTIGVCVLCYRTLRPAAAQ
jgi:hypothetical protein